MTSDPVNHIQELFCRFAAYVSRLMGHPGAFVVASMIIIVWALTGPLFQFSDTWQLLINTATTIVTFLMVFLIQNTQNREAAGLQLKLDELIRATRGAQNTLLNVEESTQEELDLVRQRYARLADDAKKG